MVTSVQQNVMQQYEQIVQLQKENRRLIISNQLTEEFVGHVKGVKHLMTMVFDRVLETLDAEAGSLWLVDNKKNQNICHLAEGPVKKGVLGLRLPAGQGVVGAVIESKQPEVILDCSKDKRFSKGVDARTGFVTRSMICVPLIIDDESYGAIQIVNKRHGVNNQFDDDDRKLVIQLAAGASLSVKNARIFEMESRVQEMHILMEISKEVVSTLDLDQVLDVVVNKTNELVDITGGSIALWDESLKRLKLVVLSGGRKLDINDENQVLLLKLMDQIRGIKRSSYVADRKIYQDSLKGKSNGWLTYMQENDLQAIWSIPLEDDEGVLGVVLFESTKAGFANGTKADLLHILSSQATVALRNASLFKSIPFSSALNKIGKKTHFFSTTNLKKRFAIGLLIILIISSLHYLPVFRWVSGPIIVEARLGQGVFLPISGKLQNIKVTEGQLIQKGQVIANLNSEQISLQLAEAQSKRAILERQIIEARADSDAVLMNKVAIERAAVIAKVIQLQQDLEHITVVSPISGVILTPQTDELVGRFFSMGDEIVRISNPKKSILIMHLPETDLMDVKVGQTVKSVLRAYPGQYFDGKVSHVGRSYDIPSTALDSSVDLEDETVKTGFIAEIEVVDAPFSMLPGMTGQALIHTQETSVIVKVWRRISNFFAFNLGI
jgi:transcriptional regulator with GAF, ATPase, and Fis domain